MMGLRGLGVESLSNSDRSSDKIMHAYMHRRLFYTIPYFSEISLAFLLISISFVNVFVFPKP